MNDGEKQQMVLDNLAGHHRRVLEAGRKLMNDPQNPFTPDEVKELVAKRPHYYKALNQLVG